MMNEQAERLRDLAKALQEKIQSQVFNLTAPCRVLTVSSGKGGVGKTNLALALSLALAGENYRVILIDADLGMANVDVILGMIPRYNLSDVFRGEKRIEEVIQEGPAGLKIIPGGSGIEEMVNLEPQALTRLLDDVAALEEKLDYLIVDTGAGISRQVMAFTLAAEEILLVTTPEPTALTDAYGLIKVFKQHQGKGRCRLVINMVKSEQEGRETAQKLVKVVQQFLKFKIEVAGFIPSDRAVAEAVRKNQSYILAFPRSPASLATMELAALLGNFTTAAKTSSGVQGFFQRIATFLRG